MKKDILKKLAGGMMVSAIVLNVGTFHIEAKTFKKNYNNGYYYSHGVSGAVSDKKIGWVS